jgi:putative toxin-antitoxin system antitoxin component (TIGR02293 family)
MTTADITILEKQSAANAIQRANEILGLNFTEVAEALGVHRQTVFRYRKLESVPSSEVQEQLAKIRELSYLLSEVFVNTEVQLEWLYSPVPLLRDRRPIDLIRKGEFDEVMSVLAGHYSGAFV